MRMRWIAPLVMFLFFAAGCPPSTVVVGGKKVPLAQAAKLTIEDARELTKAGKAAEAIAKYRELLKRYPSADNVDAAWMELGEVLLAQGEAESAVHAFQQVVIEHPQSPRYLQAAVQYGLGLVKLGRTAEALPTLQSVFDQLPNKTRRREVAAMLVRSYVEAGAALEALRWMSVVHQLSPKGPAREQLRQGIVELIDRDLSFVQVREAFELFSEKNSEGFPSDVIQLKLAKIFYHIHDFQRARKELENFVATWPEHAFAGEAGRLLKKIIDRNRVNPQAIGVLLPLTGKYREYGRKALAGIQLGAGIFDPPAKGKDGKPLAAPLLIIRDTGGEAVRAAEQMERLVFDEHVVAVIGPLFTGEAYSAAVKAQELEVPILTLSARPKITDVGSFVFRSFLTLEMQARLLVGFAMEKLGVKRFGLLYPNDKYGVGFVNAFWDEVSRRKGEVRAAERYEPDSKNFAAPIKKMVGRYTLRDRWDFLRERRRIYKETNTNLARKRKLEKLLKGLPPIVDFEALFVPDYVDKVVLIAPALAFEDILLQTTSHWQIDRYKKALGRDKLDMVYLMGGNGWNNPNLVKWAERYVQGAIFCDGFFLESTRPATRRFVGKYKANFDGEPSMIEAQGYDAALVVQHIIEKAKVRDRRAFREALLQIKKFEAATGRTTFLPNGEADKELFLLRIKKEEIVEIEPDPPAHEG
ncbi:MAG: penicillin-binding protein activator [Deltaproteobacteria bacterium]|nr:penicillin-binding protein activator [Deltaproteobacteria bacterium]